MYFSKLTSKKLLHLFFPEHFYSHGKNSVFLNSGQTRGDKHSFAPPPPPFPSSHF